VGNVLNNAYLLPFEVIMSRPESIAGGCLCGAIRFTISFPNDADWPPQGVRPLPSLTLSLAYDLRMAFVNAQCAASMVEA
jgi:hypothetical protein